MTTPSVTFGDSSLREGAIGRPPKGSLSEGAVSPTKYQYIGTDRIATARKHRHSPFSIFQFALSLPPSHQQYGEARQSRADAQKLGDAEGAPVEAVGAQALHEGAFEGIEQHIGEEGIAGAFERALFIQQQL